MKRLNFHIHMAHEMIRKTTNNFWPTQYTCFHLYWTHTLTFIIQGYTINSTFSICRKYNRKRKWWSQQMDMVHHMWKKGHADLGRQCIHAMQDDLWSVGPNTYYMQFYQMLKSEDPRKGDPRIKAWEDLATSINKISKTCIAWKHTFLCIFKQPNFESPLLHIFFLSTFSVKDTYVSEVISILVMIRFNIGTTENQQFLWYYNFSPFSGCNRLPISSITISFWNIVHCITTAFILHAIHSNIRIDSVTDSYSIREWQLLSLTPTWYIHIPIPSSKL